MTLQSISISVPSAVLALWLTALPMTPASAQWKPSDLSAELSVDHPTAASSRLKEIPAHVPARLAGGGVLFEQKAIPVGCDPQAIACIYFEYSGKDQLEMRVHADAQISSYITEDWLFQDAFRLVNAEKEADDKRYRLVDLLGTPSFEEQEAVWASNQSRFGDNEWHYEHFYFTQVIDELIGSRTGEILLAVDVLQTDPLYYSHYVPSWKREPEKKNLPFMLRVPQLIETAHRIEVFKSHLDSLCVANYRIPCDYLIGDWTYCDDNVDFQFELSGEEVELSGDPWFSYLGSNPTVQRDLSGLSHGVQASPIYLHQLNPDLFKYANDFNRITAFFRTIRDQSPQVWQVMQAEHELFIEKSGDTPRMIRI